MDATTDSASDQPPVAPGTGMLQHRFRVLMSRSKGADGRPMSYKELQTAITKATGHTVTASTLHKIATGAVSNPHADKLLAIATYFGVPVDYLLGRESDDSHARALDLLDEAVRNAGVEKIALRAQGLSDKALVTLATLIDQARIAEGLDRPNARAYRPKQDGPTPAHSSRRDGGLES
jgi:transcriptional regulator with XRE-family HTH domain